MSATQSSAQNFLISISKPFESVEQFMLDAHRWCKQHIAFYTHILGWHIVTSAHNTTLSSSTRFDSMYEFDFDTIRVQICIQTNIEHDVCLRLVNIRAFNSNCVICVVIHTKHTWAISIKRISEKMRARQHYGRYVLRKDRRIMNMAWAYTTQTNRTQKMKTT